MHKGELMGKKNIGKNANGRGIKGLPPGPGAGALGARSLEGPSEKLGSTLERDWTVYCLMVHTVT